jgi:hypothetical protein
MGITRRPGDRSLTASPHDLKEHERFVRNSLAESTDDLRKHESQIRTSLKAHESEMRTSLAVAADNLRTHSSEVRSTISGEMSNLSNHATGLRAEAERVEIARQAHIVAEPYKRCFDCGRLLQKYTRGNDGNDG